MSIHIPASEGEAATAVVRTSLPEALPILPLRDSVPFPEALTPLAIGQERSIQLVNDVLGGNRMLVMVASEGSRRRGARPRRPLPRRRRRRGRAHAQGARRHAADPRPRRPAGAHRGLRLRASPTSSRRSRRRRTRSRPSPELEALHRNVQTTFSRIIEELPYLPEELQVAVANLDDPSELAHMIAGALRIETEEKQQLLEERDVARRLRLLSELLARELELVAIGSKIQSQVHSEMEKGQREYFLRQQLKAIQEELGEVDETQAEANELREQLEQAGLPEHAWKQAERELQRFERLPPQAAEHGVIRTYLEWLATLPWSDSTDGQLRPQARARGARPRPLRHREGQGPHPRVPGGAQAQARRALLDPLLRRPARRRQDLARPLDRRGDGTQVRAHLGRRRARRVRDPRPPPHLHRRDAGHDRARAARRRLEQPGADDRRDRQDGRGLPRRPVERDARGARSRAELDLPRPLPRPAVRPLERLLHLHREPARPDPAGAARPHGGDRALGLHARGEARDRQALPGAASDGAQRRRTLEDRVHRRRRSTC